MEAMRRRHGSSLCLLAGIAVAACDAGPTGLRAARVPPKAAQVTTDRVLDLSPFRFYSGLRERERLVIRRPGEWGAAWQRITAASFPARPLPPVDFSRELVVLAAMGERPTGGYSITIDGVFEARGRLYVQVRETSPGRNCIVTEALTQPIDAVRVPRHDGTVAFVERAETRSCR